MKIDASNGPIYEQIISGIIRQIATGKLKPGEKIPSTRELAITLRVNPNTILHAYNDLERQRIIETRRGLGCFVLESIKVATLKQKLLKEIADEFTKNAKALQCTEKESLTEIKNSFNRTGGAK